MQYKSNNNKIKTSNVNISSGRYGINAMHITPRTLRGSINMINIYISVNSVKWRVVGSIAIVSELLEIDRRAKADVESEKKGTYLDVIDSLSCNLFFSEAISIRFIRPGGSVAVVDSIQLGINILVLCFPLYSRYAKIIQNVRTTKYIGEDVTKIITLLLLLSIHSTLAITRHGHLSR